MGRNKKSPSFLAYMSGRIDFFRSIGKEQRAKKYGQALDKLRSFTGGKDLTFDEITPDRMLPLDELWAQYKRIIKDNGAIALFGQGMFTARLMTSNPGMWRYNLIWQKGGRCSGFLNAKKQPLREHEDICIFYKKQPTYNPQMANASRTNVTIQEASKTRNRQIDVMEILEKQKTSYPMKNTHAPLSESNVLTHKSMPLRNPLRS